MPRYGLTTPIHPSQALAAAIGRQIALSRPAPNANLAKMADVHAEVGRVYDHAQMLGDEGPSGYRVDGWKLVSDTEPRTVRLAKTSLDDWLQENAYGNAWDEIRATLLDLAQLKGHRLAPDYSSGGGLENTLERPMYIATVEPAAAKSMAQTRAVSHDGIVQVSPEELAQFNSTASRGLNHEVGHVAAPPNYGPQFLDGVARDLGSRDYLTRALLDESHDASRATADEAAKTVIYRNRPSEFLANLGHLRRLEYGLTGNTTTTPAGISQAFDRWLGGKAPPVRRHSPRGFGRFDDPVMEHGPNAGQPAEGYHDMLQSLRFIYEKADPKDQRVIRELLPRVSSVQGGASGIA